MTTPTLIDQSNGLDDDEPGESILQEELQLLEAIYVNELTLQKDDKDWPSCLSVRLHPATGDVQEQQYVCLTLELTPPHDYPTSLPGIAIRNPRGLAEEHVNDLRKTLGDLAQERRGYPMLYELIECAKDSLTHGNVPHGHCAICRDDFDTETELTRTDCYHYFHSHCLLRYVTHCVTTAMEEEEHRLPHADTRQDRQSLALHPNLPTKPSPLHLILCICYYCQIVSKQQLTWQLASELFADDI
ncbi:hypothetical protein NP493_401g04031 [Ridgeia piscesae]|uniref:RWD domain-containing protein n=1 Tax=Ridgeia piscesae TaxID=27915 RepID=A0AAD9L1L8_RIDPI|nr:hypothetical protein NP493_401g04031 [Ridgeia piscesae]